MAIDRSNNRPTLVDIDIINVFCIKKTAFSDTATEAAGTMSSASVPIDLADSSRKSLESSLRDISQQSEKG